ncbi:MAG: hypothetical protein DLM62_10250 [Pseudonocardiales bacterium]|nr:MAG: hypothetical protein DLM62_10250 [Pseudonocardiales bacterium]
MNDTARNDAVNTTELIRLGILAMPVAGALKLLGNLGTFNSIGYGIPQASEAATVTGAGFFAGELVGSIFPVLLTPFWVFALFAYLTPTAGRLALIAGMVCCLLGTGITLPALGVINYAIPALGHAYQSGQPDVMAIADSFFTWPRGAMLYPAVLFPIGTILFTIAAWRGAVLPRVAVLLCAVSGVLIAIPIPLHSVRLAGGAIGLAAGAWIAFAVRRRFQTLVTAPAVSGWCG